MLTDILTKGGTQKKNGPEFAFWTTYIRPLVRLIATKPGFESQQRWSFKFRESSSQANDQDQISYSSFLVSMSSKDIKSNSRQHICDQSKRAHVAESNKTLNVQAESETEPGEA